MIMAVGSRG